METTTIYQAIFEIFAAIISWLGDAIEGMTPIFWTGTELTLMGTLSILGLGFSVCFLNHIGRSDREIRCGSSLIAGKSF